MHQLFFMLKFDKCTSHVLIFNVYYVWMELAVCKKQRREEEVVMLDFFYHIVDCREVRRALKKTDGKRFDKYMKSSVYNLENELETIIYFGLVKHNVNPPRSSSVKGIICCLYARFLYAGFRLSYYTWFIDVTVFAIWR